MNEQSVLSYIRYEVNLSDDFKIAVVTPIVTFISPRTQTLIYDLCADGHELIPAALLRLPPGESSHTLLSVTLINPRLWFPNGYGIPSLYRMTFRYGKNGESMTESVQHISVSHHEIKNKTTFFNHVPVTIYGVSAENMDYFSDEIFKRLVNLSVNALTFQNPSAVPETFKAQCVQYGFLILPEPESYIMSDSVKYDFSFPSSDNPRIQKLCTEYTSALSVQSILFKERKHAPYFPLYLNKITDLINANGEITALAHVMSTCFPSKSGQRQLEFPPENKENTLRITEFKGENGVYYFNLSADYPVNCLRLRADSLKTEVNFEPLFADLREGDVVLIKMVLSHDHFPIAQIKSAIKVDTPSTLFGSPLKMAYRLTDNSL